MSGAAIAGGDSELRVRARVLPMAKQAGETAVEARLRSAREQRAAADLQDDRMRRLLPLPVERYANMDYGCRFTATGIACIGFVCGAGAAGVAFAAVMLGLL